MEETYHMYGMKITVSGDIDEARRRGQLARKLMFQTKNLNSNNLDIIKGNMRLDDGTAVEVLSQHGLDSAKIYVPPISPKKTRVKKIIKIPQIIPALEAYNEDREFLGYILFPFAGMGDSEDIGPDGWGGVREFVPAADPEGDDSAVDPFEWGQWLEHFDEMPFDDVNVFLSHKLVPYIETLFEIPPHGTVNRAFQCWDLISDTYTGGMIGSYTLSTDNLYNWSFADSGGYEYAVHFYYNEAGEGGAEPPETDKDFRSLPWGDRLSSGPDGYARGSRTLTGKATAKKKDPHHVVAGFYAYPQAVYKSVEKIDTFNVTIALERYSPLIGSDLFQPLGFLPGALVEYKLDRDYGSGAPEYMYSRYEIGSEWFTTVVNYSGEYEEENFRGESRFTSVYSDTEYALAYPIINASASPRHSDSFWSYGDAGDFVYFAGADFYNDVPGAYIVTDSLSYSNPRIMVDLSGEEYEIEDVFVSEDSIDEWFALASTNPSPITIRYYNLASEFLICALDLSEIRESECEYRYVFGYTTEDGVVFDDSLVLSGDREGGAMVPDMKGPNDEPLYVTDKFRLMRREREQIIYDYEIEAV